MALVPLVIKVIEFDATNIMAHLDLFRARVELSPIEHLLQDGFYLSYQAQALRVVLSAWLIAIAIWDMRTARIPNGLTLPVMLAAGIWRLYHQAWIILPLWILMYIIWRFNIIGGGDAKLLMGLFTLFPTYEFAFLFSVVVLVVSLPALVRKYWWQRPAQMAQGIVQRVQAGQLFPTQEELQTQGLQYAWAFCLPGLIYLWWFW